MSVEESLQYFEDTIAGFDKSHEKQVYESESDLLSEFGYASGYTELSVTSGSEKPHKQIVGGNRRRKTRQNRNQRYQSDPILGDLESDSTNDGQLFGNANVPRTRTRTNSGQRRQRERRRQRRQTVNRNSWTDSGLSLSKTDSQRSSHSENSPVKRARSKTSPAGIDQHFNFENKDIESCKLNKEKVFAEEQEQAIDSGVYSPSLSIESPEKKKDEDLKEEEVLEISEEEVKKESNNVDQEHEEYEEHVTLEVNEKDDLFFEEHPAENSSTLRTVEQNSKIDQNVFDIKPTNLNGVVNGTYTPKEKEILRQVFAKAQHSTQGDSNCRGLQSRQVASKFPLPAHLDYPFCMFQAGEKKEKKSNGIIRGLKKLRQGISSKKNSPMISVAKARNIQTKSGHSVSQTQSGLPPSKFVDKKKGFLRKLFKQNSESTSKSKKSEHFSRDRFGSTRSFSGSVSQLFARGNRARSHSVENLKNYFKRERGSFIKRTNSSVSLNDKITRSISVSSLIGRRNKFERHGSTVSIAAQSNGSNFRRANSLRSLHGGGDIATRVLQYETQDHQMFYEDRNSHPHQTQFEDFNLPFRAGWRPASRLSRRDPYAYDAPQYYREDDVYYDDCYDNEEPCPCCCDEQYYEDGYYNDFYEHSIDQYYEQPNYRTSSVTLANLDTHSVSQRFSRNPSMHSVHSSYGRLQSQASSSYCSPASIRKNEAMVVAPLSVQVTHERRAERRQISRASQVFDTMV